MQNTTRSLGSVIYNKFLSYVEENTTVDIFIDFAKAFTWIVISIFLVNIPVAMEKLLYVVKYGDFAIIKILLAFIVVYFARDILGAIKSFFSYLRDLIPEIPKDPVHGPIYMGIPVVELVDYLFTSESYNRDLFCSHFAVGRKVFDDLASSLDSIKVFVRGQNNARTLSSEFSRADISSILSRACETGEIRPLIRKVENGYTHRPSMEEIIERSPSPHFVTRPLSSFRVSA